MRQPTVGTDGRFRPAGVNTFGAERTSRHGALRDAREVPVTEATIAADRRSWVPGADGSGRPLQHLPFGVVRPSPGAPWRVAVAIGPSALDLAVLAEEGLLDGALADPAAVTDASSLASLVARPSSEWRSLRARVADLLDARDTELAGTGTADRALLPLDTLEVAPPVVPGDIVDFYASEAHATHVGELFRPDSAPLLPNWRHLPVGYHGRSGTVQVSGQPVVRPWGQHPPQDEGGSPGFGPSERLDLELEVGVVVGGATEAGRLNPPGSPIPVDRVEEHLFGVVLVNDWSARDLQAWEYRPLGPFLGKSFATTIGGWVTPWDALDPWRVSPPTQEPAPPDYLRTEGRAALAIDLEVAIASGGDEPVTVSRVAFAEMYWTFPQMVAHATVNGTSLRPGDLFASGTVSGWDEGTAGCLLEATRGGERPVDLGGVERTWLRDGDTVRLSGRCTGDGGPELELAEATATVLPAVAADQFS